MRSMLLIRICALAALLFAGGLLRAQLPQFSSPEEKAAWVKAHPAEYQRALDESGKAAPQGELVTKTSVAKQAPKAVDEKAASDKAEYARTHSTKAVQPKPLMPAEVKPVDEATQVVAPSVSETKYTYTPTLKDSEIPAAYKASSDFENPAVRERIEKDIKAGKGIQEAKPAAEERVISAPVVEATTPDLPEYHVPMKSDEEVREHSKPAYYAAPTTTFTPVPVSTPEPLVKQKISSVDLATMSASEQAEILGHPEKYEVVYKSPIQDNQ